MHFTLGGIGQARRKSAKHGLTGGPLSAKHLRSAGLVLEPRQNGNQGGSDKALRMEPCPVNNSEALTSVPAREALGKLKVSDFLGHRRIEVAGSSPPDLRDASESRVPPAWTVAAGPYSGGTLPQLLGQVLGGNHGQQPVHRDPELGATKVSCSG